MNAIDLFRQFSRNNAWSNNRIYRACAKLDATAFRARRPGFYPSIAATLEHMLEVDWFHLDALTQGGKGRGVFTRAMPTTLADLSAAQDQADRQLIAFCDAANDDRLSERVTVARNSGPTSERIDAVLSHMIVQQIHHRGQAHAMLAGTKAPPPQLDEFFLDHDLPRRRADLARLKL